MLAVASTSTQSSSTTTSVTIPVPSNVSNGDVVVATVSVGSFGTSMTPPSGFELAQSSPINSTSYIYIYWKRATSAESGDYIFTFPSVNNRAGSAMRITGCPRSGNPFDVVTTNTSTSTSTAAVSLETSVADTILLWAVAHAGQTNLSTFPDGFTTLLDIGQGEVAYKVLTASKLSGTVQGTLSVSGGNQTWLGAIKPETGFGAFFL